MFNIKHSKIFYNSFIDEINQKLLEIDLDLFHKSSKSILKVKKKNGKLIFLGNGGSAAIASHCSVDFTKVCKIRSINFNEADLLTCYSNDFGQENWAKECLKSYADPKDLLIAISSSGNSANIVNACLYARSKNIEILTLTGFSKKNKVKKLGNINLWVESDKYNIIESVHQTFLLSICDYIKNEK